MVHLITGVKIIVEYIRSRVETDDPDAYQEIPPPQDRTTLRGQESPCRNGDQGHGEGPRPGGDEIIFDFLFPIFLPLHNFTNI